MAGNNRAPLSLPDTQILTDDLSQSLYMEQEPSAPVWARLVFIPNPKITFDLRYENAWFGRETPNDENMDVFVFTNELMEPRMVDRISKCHFKISNKGSGETKSGHNYSPAVLTCHGRNGLYIRDDKLNVGDEQILTHNGIIKLTRKFELFKFFYASTPPEIEALPTVCLQKYHIGAQIGSGGCGIVRLVHNVKTLEKYAMKLIKKETNPMVRSRVADNAKILNEVDIMRKLSHPHILSFTECFETPDRVVIITEYMMGGDLLHRITKFDPTRKNLSEFDAKFFFLQVCRGIKYLHDSFVTHRDIKPDNILLASDSKDALLKISDFGLSKLISVDSMKTICGTQLYVAPEVLMGGVYNSKVDIWSLGCMLFAMLSGSVPFCEEYGPPSVQHQIKEARYSFKSRAWNNVTRTARELIRTMIQKDPQKRPSIDEVLQHPWLHCRKTFVRVQKLYNLDETLINSSDETSLELTMVKVSIDESAQPPPLKRPRYE